MNIFKLIKFIKLWIYRIRNKLPKDSFISISTVIRGRENISFGRNFSCGENCHILAENGTIKIGDNVSLNYNVCINASMGGEIVLDNNTLIGPNVLIISHSHIYDIPNTLKRNSGHKSGNIQIGHNVWIGANSVVLYRSRVPNDSIIGACSLINKKLPKSGIYGGNPGRLVKEFND